MGLKSFLGIKKKLTSEELDNYIEETKLLYDETFNSAIPKKAQINYAYLHYTKIKNLLDNTDASELLEESTIIFLYSIALGSISDIIYYTGRPSNDTKSFKGQHINYYIDEGFRLKEKVSIYLNSEEEYADKLKGLKYFLNAVKFYYEFNEDYKKAIEVFKIINKYYKEDKDNDKTNERPKFIRRRPSRN